MVFEQLHTVVDRLHWIFKSLVIEDGDVELFVSPVNF